MKKFSALTRPQQIKKMQQETFDLIIIGGGINGAGVARDAAQRGLKVALIEKNDFAFGTSSRSSKLIHGGIRYLENYDFKLVFEALNERTKLFEMAPHLSHPLRFMIPLYKSSRVSMFKMGLGMWLYDALSLFQAPEMHERLDADETLDRNPSITAKDLCGSFVYSDGYMDDDRLVHETLRSAFDYGALCVNYVSAIKQDFKIFQETGLRHVVAYDEVSKNQFTIKGRHIVCTVGPWSDLVAPEFVQNWKNILRPTKGIHLTFERQRIPLQSAVVMAAEKSNRIVFAIPRHEMVIVGTTDTDYKDDPKQAIVTAEDVTYLLNITNQYFEGLNLSEEDIISSYVGVRPLVKDQSDSEGKTSREHTIMSDKDSGVTLVAGGKYTTYRLMAEQIVNETLKYLDFNLKGSLKPCNTYQPFNSWTHFESYLQAQNEAANDLQKHFALRYGLEYKNILLEYGYSENIWAIEAYQAIHTTMCLNLVDFFTRRVPLMLAEKDHGLFYLAEIAQVFAQELNWTPEETQKQINDYKKYIQIEMKWKK